MSRETQARIASNTAIAALNLPIGPLLRALQPPPDIRVGLLALEVIPPKVEGDQVGTDAVISCARKRPLSRKWPAT